MTPPRFVTPFALFLTVTFASACGPSSVAVPDATDAHAATPDATVIAPDARVAVPDALVAPDASGAPEASVIARDVATDVPVDAPGAMLPPSPVVQLALGQTHACALLANHTVRCWGHNQYGQLGDGTTTPSRATPYPVVGLDDATQIATTGAHVCALRANGRVKCWGYNHDGQLGDGSATASSTPVDVAGVTTATRVMASSTRSCAQLADGSFVCWVNSLPDTVLVPMNSTAMSLGNFHTCVTRFDRTSWCIGRHNESGQLGNGTTVAPMVATDWTQVTNATDVAETIAAVDVGCVRRNDGTARCWGKNESGQIGDGTTTNALVATDVRGITGALRLVHGGAHGCALLADHTLSCWGDDFYGQLGDDMSMTTRSTPAAVPDFGNVVEVSAGLYGTCARRDDGTVWCWGQNLYYQLGDGTQIERHRPAMVRW